jgi:hypothetical protein
MEKATIKILGDALRQQLLMQHTELPDKLRRLIDQLERRQRELDQLRAQPRKTEPH